jgi:hypothetical protein
MPAVWLVGIIAKRRTKEKPFMALTLNERDLRLGMFRSIRQK